MKKRIYILPDSPSEGEFKAEIGSLNPPLSPPIEQNLLNAFARIKQSVRDAALDSRNLVGQTQTVSDGCHTITLLGRLEQPNWWQRLLS